MSGRPSVPSAWDDDWTPKAESSKPPPPSQPTKISKAERRAQHAEQQRQLWDTADNPSRNLWLESQGAVPLRQDPKPAVTLLSRKPPQIAKRSSSTQPGIAGLSLEDDDDSEEERLKKQASEREERARRAKIEHEEKQKRYAEARERIMGASSQTTLLASSSRESSTGRDPRRGKGRPNGNYGNGNAGNHNGGQRRSQPETPVEQSPARQMQIPEGQQLFNPEDTSRRPIHKREASSSNGQDKPVRQPRGPEVSGRGGYGFANRGGISNA